MKSNKGKRNKSYESSSSYFISDSRSNSSYRSPIRNKSSYSASSASIKSVKKGRIHKESYPLPKHKRRSYSNEKYNYNRRSKQGNGVVHKKKYLLNKNSHEYKVEAKKSRYFSNTRKSDYSVSPSESSYHKRRRSYPKRTTNQNQLNYRRPHSRSRSKDNRYDYRRSVSPRLKMKNNGFRSSQHESSYNTTRPNHYKSDTHYSSSFRRRSYCNDKRRSPQKEYGLSSRYKNLSYEKNHYKDIVPNKMTRNIYPDKQSHHTRDGEYRFGRGSKTMNTNKYDSMAIAKPLVTRDDYTFNRKYEINRSTTCPFLLRVFFNMHKHHSLEDFNRYLPTLEQQQEQPLISESKLEMVDESMDSREHDKVDEKESTQIDVDKMTNFLSSELQLYTWKDTSLREIVDLVKDVCPEARNRSSRLSLKLFHMNENGTYSMFDLGTLHNSRPGVEDRKTLLRSRFEIGDVISIAIYPISYRKSLNSTNNQFMNITDENMNAPNLVELNEMNDINDINEINEMNDINEINDLDAKDSKSISISENLDRSNSDLLQLSAEPAYNNNISNVDTETHLN